MEWLRRMKLKKALFTIAFLNITVALILSLLAIWGCAELRSYFAADGIGIIMDAQSEQVVVRQMPKGGMGEEAAVEILSLVQILLPIVIYICALFLSASMFYRWKLRGPIEALTKGADRIIENDLDFTIEAGAGDELGQLCTAFETMRETLLVNNRELWRQAEERRRLNAAFAHDLRNPVTVLKGSVKLAKNVVTKGTMTYAERRAEQRKREEQGEQREQLVEHLQRIEDYTNRIEQYVETMSSIQNLEEITAQKEHLAWNGLMSDLENMIRIMGEDSPKEICFQAEQSAADVWVDSSIFFQIAENLVSNAIRFSTHKIAVECSNCGENLSFTVMDDGCGFSAKLLQNGIQPFQKGGEEAEHFGMGLYISRLLCEKHGGSLTLQNNLAARRSDAEKQSCGATVCAVIKIQ